MAICKKRGKRIPKPQISSQHVPKGPYDLVHQKQQICPVITDMLLMLMTAPCCTLCHLQSLIEQSQLNEQIYKQIDYG